MRIRRRLLGHMARRKRVMVTLKEDVTVTQLDALLKNRAGTTDHFHVVFTH